jgi:flagellar hook-associated protein FlgK
MLHGKEKIYFLVNRLIDERDITPSGQLIGLHPTNDLNNLYLPQDFINLLDKLEKEENAAKFISLPTDQTYLKYQVKLLPGFDKYVAKLEEDPGYLDWSGKKPKPKNYFSKERRIDFSKSKEENKDKYISVGQIEELMKMPKDERAKIEKNNLTQKHLDDIDSFQKNLKDTAKAMKPRLEAMFANIKLPDLSHITQSHMVEAYAPPPNYQAQSVNLLRQLVEKQKAEDAKSEDKVVLTITYSSSRQLVMNGVFQLSRPTLNGVNDLVFNHLYQNPGKTFGKQELEAAIGQNISKTLHKIVENLGFKGDLAKAFFSVSKNDISFRNQITRDELNDMGLGNIKLG